MYCRLMFHKSCVVVSPKLLCVVRLTRFFRALFLLLLAVCPYMCILFFITCLVNESSNRWKQKLPHLNKKMNEVTEDALAPKPSTCAAMTSTVKDKVRMFREDWLRDFDWLRYDSQKKLIMCLFCMEKPHISCKTDFATGCSNFEGEILTKPASSS